MWSHVETPGMWSVFLISHPSAFGFISRTILVVHQTWGGEQEVINEINKKSLVTAGIKNENVEHQGVGNMIYYHPLSTLLLHLLRFQASTLHISFFPLISSDGQRRLTHSFRESEGALMSSWQIEQSSTHSRDGVRHRTHHLRLTEVRGDVSVWWSHHAGTSSSLWCQHGYFLPYTENGKKFGNTWCKYPASVFIHYTWWVLTINFNLITGGNTVETLDLSLLLTLNYDDDTFSAYLSWLQSFPKHNHSPDVDELAGPSLEV